MKIPDKPPDWRKEMQKVIEDYEPKEAIKILSGMETGTANGKYIHWDKTKYLDPPEGLTRNTWWLGMKLSRSRQYKELPLLDCKGRPIQYMMTDKTYEYLHQIDKSLGSVVGSSYEGTITEQTRNRYLIRSLAEESITSSQLEGAVVTRKVAKEMLRNNRTPKSKDELMIFNNYIAMSKVRDHIKKPLTKSLILELHDILTDGTLDDPSAAGRFRRVDEDINVVDEASDEIMHSPPSADELDARIGRLCDIANGKAPDYFIHPVLRSIIVHFGLSYIHPFVDGNGRCARALFYWCMLKNDYWLCEYISISSIIKNAPAKYARAFLYTETDDNDVTYFMLYHLKILKKAGEELHKFIDRTRNKMATTQNLLASSGLSLNHRQLALLTHSLKNPFAKYTVKGHAASHKVVLQTARSDLQELLTLGLLSSSKEGRTHIYIPVSNLAEIMRKKQSD